MDILCVKCGEPWDAYGLTHGDVRAWEADMIRQGIGCPSCEGEKKRNLTFSEVLENETATEGLFIEELDNKYGPSEDYVEICRCYDCQNQTIKVDVNDIYYDGSRKKIYHNSGSVLLEDRGDIIRYAEIEYDWHTVEGHLLCEDCYNENYFTCEYCSDVCPTEYMMCTNNGNEVLCEYCYIENYVYCEECNEDCHIDYMKTFNDKIYCEYCYDKYVTECEMCDKEILKEDVIEGKNGEICCSEKCADDTTNEV